MPVITEDFFQDNKNKLKIKKRKSLVYKLMILIIVLMIIILMLDINMRPIIKSMCEYQGKIIATQLINEAVYNTLNDPGLDYNNLVKVIKDKDNKILGIESDAIKINKLQSQIMNNVVGIIGSLEKRTLSIAIGSLIGAQYLYGRGPSIDFIISPAGNVKSKVISEFKSAGINQTHHKIIFNIEANISILIPFYTARVTVPADFTISETIIVGDVPEYFTEVISASEKTVSDINDYGNADRID